MSKRLEKVLVIQKLYKKKMKKVLSIEPKLDSS